MKSLSLMLRVEATRPPTLIDAPRPKSMPLGLSRNTLPLAVRLPRMLEGSGPSTRLRAIELLSGCTNWTASVAPMLKLCQLIATFWLVWVMVVLPAELLMAAPPSVTTPPTGRAKTFAPNAIISETARAFRAKRAFSAAATGWHCGIDRVLDFILFIPFFR